MICLSWDPDRVERIIRKGLADGRGSVMHIYLKDVETVQGEPDRLQRWASLVRRIVEEA